MEPGLVGARARALNTLATNCVRRRRWISIWLDGLCLSIVAIITVIGFSSPHFTADSWSLFELSKHVFDDFYRVNTYRQFQFNSPYGVSFPPMIPVLLAISRLICDAGIYTGLFLNVIIATLTLWQLKRLACSLSLPIWAGNAWLLFLLANFDYSDELIGGKSFPLAILLLTVVLRIWVGVKHRGVAQPIGLGIGCGLLSLTRFDFLIASFMWGIIGRWAPSNWKLRQTALFYISLTLVVSPWCFYSVRHFGKLFVSDNSRTVLSAERTTYLDYFDEGRAPPTLLDAPLKWSKLVISQRLPTMRGSTMFVIYRYFPIMLLGGIVTGIAMAGAPRTKDFFDNQQFRLLLWAGVALSGQLFAVCLAGYPDVRYLIPFVFYFTVLALYAILRCDTAASKHTALCHYGLPLLALLTLGSFVREFDFRPVMERLPPKFDSDLLDPAQYAVMTTQLQDDVEHPRLLVIRKKSKDRLDDGRIMPQFDPFRFGALTDIVTFVAPPNLSQENFPSFLRRYEVTHVLLMDADWVTELEKMGFFQSPVHGLYRTRDVIHATKERQ